MKIVAKQQKYRAFISYSSKNKKIATWLHRKNENYSISKEFREKERTDGRKLGQYLRPVFRDRDELSGSAKLGSALQDALTQSEYLIVLCSPESAGSFWVNEEIKFFSSVHGEDNVLTLIIDGQPNATGNPDISSDQECFPPALRYPAEPLAGDLRKEGDGKERGFLKIMSGLSGIPFAKLYQRHERAKRERQLVFTSSALIIIAALTILSLLALRSAAAERKARNASDSLVGFMMDDLFEDLRKTGRLGVLSSSVEKIKAHQVSNPSTPENRIKTGLNHVKILFETGEIQEATDLGKKLLKEVDLYPELEAQKAKLNLTLADYFGWQTETFDLGIKSANSAISFYLEKSNSQKSYELAQAKSY